MKQQSFHKPSSVSISASTVQSTLDSKKRSKASLNTVVNNSSTVTSKKNSLIYKSIYLNMDKLQQERPSTNNHYPIKKDDPNNRLPSRERTYKHLNRNSSIRNSNHSNASSQNAQENNTSSLIKPLSKGSLGLSKVDSTLLKNNFFKQSNSSFDKYNVGPENNNSYILRNSDPSKLTKHSFNYHYIIGKGGFGKVWKVESKKNRQFFALKEMLKSLVMAKKSIQSVMNEKKLLATIDSPFIVNMHYAFQDRQTLFLAMDLMPGGDLRYHIGTRKKFSEIQSKFFIACIVIGLEYLHEQNMIHRDIKPENLVLDHKGYIRITDLGIARVYRESNSCDTSGTPGYMSPEVICRQDHSFVSDYFALGVIAYELMFGKRPYNGRSRKQIRDQILAKQVSVKRTDVPDDWSYEAADFINRLIQRKPQSRLGYNGTYQVKEHPWLRELNWKKLYNKEIESPFIPQMKKDNFDQDEQITLDDEQQVQLIEKNALLLRRPEYQEIFKGYEFDRDKDRPRRQSSYCRDSFEKIPTNDHSSEECRDNSFQEKPSYLNTGSQSRASRASAFDTNEVPAKPDSHLLQYQQQVKPTSSASSYSKNYANNNTSTGLNQRTGTRDYQHRY